MVPSINSRNLIGLRRSGYREHIEPLRRAFDILFRSGHVSPVAIDLVVAELG